MKKDYIPKVAWVNGYSNRSLNHAEDNALEHAKNKFPKGYKILTITGNSNTKIIKNFISGEITSEYKYAVTLKVEPIKVQ